MGRVCVVLWFFFLNVLCLKPKLNQIRLRLGRLGLKYSSSSTGHHQSPPLLD